MPWLVRVFFGSDYAAATDAARIILVAAAIQLVLGWTKSFPVSIGRPGLRLVAHGVETAVLLPCVLVLGDRFGATGAAAAVLIATVAFALTWGAIMLRLRREPLPRGSVVPPAELTAPL
jgi:O-antigen/teichoic acid export membrane protein